MCKMDRNELFQRLFNAIVKANPQRSKKNSQDEAVRIWNKSKENPTTQEQFISEKLSEIQAKATLQRGTLLKFWGQASASTSKQKETVSVPALESQRAPVEVQQPSENADCDDQLEPHKKRPAFVQDQLKLELAKINSEIVKLREKEDSGLLTDEGKADLNRYLRERKQKETDLKTRALALERQQRFRDEKKKSMKNLFAHIPEAKDHLRPHSSAGRPPLEERQPDLLKTIVDIAMHGSAAEEKRHDERYRSVKTLSELTEALKHKGFHISRSGTYLRLIPHRATSTEGNRHVNTVPVKLLKARNDSHKLHQDGKFCTSTINVLEQLASILGPNEVCFLSQDDKARVVMGLTAANKQAPILMHVEYRVNLPDHDFVVAAKHKLIPSVIAGCVIKSGQLGRGEAVGYSGPTYVAVRSGKHCYSTAFSHGLDFNRVCELPEFDEIIRYQETIKPIIIITVDGGPDENPRYKKVINMAIHHFLEFDLDAILIATNAPGRSAFNRVERRMAPLSRELAGLILPHDHYGSHLDAKLRTNDPELEARNFKFAGETLADVWNDLAIDGYPVKAEYIEPDSSQIDESEIGNYSVEWFAQHVRTSQYFLQVVKCKDRNCCKEPRSSYFCVNQHQFLPAPVPLSQTPDGLKAPSPTDVNFTFPSLFVRNSINLTKILPKPLLAYQELPYDTYCPSQQGCLKTRICKTCSIYFASQVMLKEHQKLHKTGVLAKRQYTKKAVAKRGKEVLVVENSDLIWTDEDSDTELQFVADVEDFDAFPVITVQDHLIPTWTDA